MRKLPLITLCLALVCALAACAAGAEQRTGQAQGYGGPLKVLVTMEKGSITNVEVTEHNETQGIGTRAIEAMPAAMISSRTWDVDIVAGATVTSNALKEAVRSAMEQN
ncbi:MAG: FMN-binding protein [Clostridia bacterium]|nr:FMN-binding protein [Clostridia bacterium]